MVLVNDGSRDVGAEVGCDCTHQTTDFALNVEDFEARMRVDEIVGVFFHGCAQRRGERLGMEKEKWKLWPHIPTRRRR